VLNKKILASGKPRNIFLSQIAYLIGGLFRKIGLANLVGAIKRNKLFNQLLFKNKKFEIKVDLQTQQQIRQYYKTDLQKLEKLINKKLPEGWLKEKK
jgi:hypothetical protein